MNCLLFWLLYAVRIILVSQKTKTIEKGTCKSKCLFLVRVFITDFTKTKSACAISTYSFYFTQLELSRDSYNNPHIRQNSLHLVE